MIETERALLAAEAQYYNEQRVLSDLEFLQEEGRQLLARAQERLIRMVEDLTAVEIRIAEQREVIAAAFLAMKEAGK